ncbi:hypothetical protein ERO13_D10G171800v2 [Gossypium hirsutum]|uniref:Uncharacterized protein n=4 Tax=Gossypium TaxID=3633 RepID=A0A5J5PTG4_GOSBA|nr:uncharacterized protein LOC107916183 [Gossypium hirsutum]KAB2009794.1 hypothetical protein ES319_D10G191400v1 [Gossypium barbadense]TYG50817.1 hypothetical protein ES288_D10G206300v1 [Gossypium darwinii]KAB2009795.1 hypothetical protein ES319_D10G191400v1 [Gossypium barbadense]KAB2009796.1 hypothetical protein ES319_D10G191400v1 [Gossypium barbadense]KAG4126687.1 hypothetical protein ERO13_D10G171800v2 [Gossypium hirsutum]
MQMWNLFSTAWPCSNTFFYAHRCDVNLLLATLCTRTIQTREGSIVKALDCNATVASRDALEKTVYARLFDWYAYVNSCLEIMTPSLTSMLARKYVPVDVAALLNSTLQMGVGEYDQKENIRYGDSQPSSGFLDTQHFAQSNMTKTSKPTC